MKKYIITNEEKKKIKEFLDYKTRYNLNFMLSSLEDNLILGSADNTNADILRDASMYSNLALKIYSCIYKQSLNEKINIDKIYIPLSNEEYNLMKSKDKNSGFLLGTLQKFVAEAKPFPEIENLVILEAELKNISFFKLDQSFEDSSLVIIGPCFKITEKEEEYEIDKEFLENNEIQERSFKKVIIEFVPNKKSEVKEENLEKLFEEAGNRSEDLSNYWKILNWTNNLEKAVEQKDVKALIKLGIEKAEEKDELKEQNKNEKTKSEKSNKETEEEANETDKSEEIKKEIEEKAEDIKKRIAILIDKTNYTENGKPGEKIKEVKDKIKDQKEEYNFEEYEKPANDQINLNYLEIHDIVKNISKWKENILKGLNFEYLKTITTLESEKNENMKNADFTPEEKRLYSEIFDVQKNNLELVDQILSETEELIKTQQKFAKIAAETNAKYAAVINGFGIRNEAFKLKEILNKEVQDFEEKYFERIVDGKKKKKTPRISTSELNEILETGRQITVFLNMVFNPKMARPNTKIDRFEELILIEENELKRQIFTYAKFLINEGNLDILEDEIDIIERKSAIKKIFDIIVGKHRIENYYIEKLEQTIDRILEISEKDLKIDKNYRIHDIIAEIMMFKTDNNDDEIIEDIIEKLSKLEVAIAKNFEVNPDKVIDVIEQKKNAVLPVAGKISKKEEIDIEIESLIKKYEYDKDIFVDMAKYDDTTKNEITKIIDYAKISEKEVN